IGPPQRLHAVLAEGDSSAWVGGEDGLYRWSRGSGSLRRVWPRQGDSEPVRSIARDLQGRLWLALLHGGLVRYSPADDESLRLRHDPDLDRGVHEDRLARVMVDRSGLLWVGGEARGLATVRPEGSSFSRVYET